MPLQAAIREVDTAGAETRLGEATFLDVREPDEYSQGTIPGAVHIPRGQLETNIEGRVTDRDAEVVVYCAGGTRSAFAASDYASVTLQVNGGSNSHPPLQVRATLSTGATTNSASRRPASRRRTR